MFYLCIVYWCCVAVSHGLRTVPLYARDFSEHCKRRDALPSVFLGRQVMEANSQVLHFSNLDLPYSCYASVRTESSHNIIMVVQIDQEPAKDFCKNGYQLAVYDFVETFGGYWGPMPDAVVDSDPEARVYTKQYTLETEPPSVDTEAAETYTTKVTTASTTTRSSSTSETQDFIDIEVPLVNLSASLVPSDTQEQKPFDIDEFFDLFYDVAPRPGRPYDTSILPLVQIAVKKQDGRREGEADGEPKYELDYNVGPFTPDHRLTVTIPEWPTKINTNRNRNRWKKKKLQDKHVELKINNSLNTSEPTTRKFFRKQYTLPTRYTRSSYKYVTPEAITEKKYETTKDKKPFNLINDIIESLNETGHLKMQEQSTHHSGIMAMLNTPETDHKLSAYLAPYPMFPLVPVSDVPAVNLTNTQSDIFFIESTENSIRMSSQDYQLDYTVIPVVEDNQSTYVNNDSLQSPNEVPADAFVTKEEIISAKEIETSMFNVLLPQEESITETSKIFSNAAATEPITDDGSLPDTATQPKSLSGTLVDHESWENVVQSAPVMAGLLNQHGPELGNSSYMNTSDSTSTRSKRRVRRKRHISAIAINEARPYRRPTTREPRPTVSQFAPADVHEFARLMELPDDQMSNRVAMNVGANISQSVLFNLCDSYDGIKSRFLHLFNSSRVLLSIANFSIPHIMVVLTTGRPLALDEQQCPETLIECQVLGTRICIDYSNTCNGIPNCGSSNAYDEDRVLCRLIGPQGSVCLAAATFLSVLVTVMYIAHYWLKRCVPNVADAFFVYADSADNELYLDSIMRSPMDTANDGNFVFDSSLFDGEHILGACDRRKSTGIFSRMFSILPKLSFFKQRQASAEGHEAQFTRQGLPGEVPKKMYSFTELEIRNIISAAKVNREVQTGESLEMAYLKMINAFKTDSSDPKHLETKKRQASVHAIVIQDVLTGQRPHSSDTSSESPGPSGGSVDNRRRSNLPAVEEEELHSTFYEPSVLGNIVKSESSKNKETTPGRKCLRFNDRTTCIPREDDDEEPAGTEPTVMRRQSVVYGLPGRVGKQLHQKPDDDDSERGGSDFRKFFRKRRDRT